MTNKSRTESYRVSDSSVFLDSSSKKMPLRKILLFLIIFLLLFRIVGTILNFNEIEKYSFSGFLYYMENGITNVDFDFLSSMPTLPESVKSIPIVGDFISAIWDFFKVIVLLVNMIWVLLTFILDFLTYFMPI